MDDEEMTTPKNPGDALAPCPFCGGHAYYNHTDAGPERKYYRVHCEKCDARIGHPYTRKDAARQAWNTRAALTPKPSGGDALDYFMKNVDGRTTLDIFKSMVTAMKNADAACVAGDDIKQDTWFNIAKCEMMDLCREHSRVIEAALTPSPDYVMVPRGTVEKLCKFIIQHKDDKFYGDHACAECYPHSELIAAGFQCAYHTAIKMQLSAAPESEG